MSEPVTLTFVIWKMLVHYIIQNPNADTFLKCVLSPSSLIRKVPQSWRLPVAYSGGCSFLKFQSLLESLNSVIGFSKNSTFALFLRPHLPDSQVEVTSLLVILVSHLVPLKWRKQPALEHVSPEFRCLLFNRDDCRHLKIT